MVDTSTYYPLNRHLDLGANRVTNIADPTAAQDAVTKNFLESGSWEADTIYVDNVLEKTADHGVNIDGVLMKDSNIDMDEDKWIGISDTDARIVFDDAEKLTFMNTSVVEQIGTGVADVYGKIYNGTSSSGYSSRLWIVTRGSGDAQVDFGVSGDVVSWSMGVDNSDGNIFKINGGASGLLDPSSLELTSAGKLTVENSMIAYNHYVRQNGGSIGLQANERFIFYTAGYIEVSGANFYLGSNGMGNNASVLTFATGGTGTATFKGGVTLDGDSLAVTFGDEQDMDIFYGGTSGYIRTDLVAASDLHIDCGTDKTLVLDETVWEDVQFPVATGRLPAANQPSWSVFTTNTWEFQFAVDDYLPLQAAEMPHWWSEGTTVHIHLHATTDAGNASGDNEYAKFTVYFAYADSGDTWTETSVTAELTIPNGTGALEAFYLDMGDVALTGKGIGTQCKITVERIAATGGDEYSDEIFITQIGVHGELNTMGSRQETAK
jgi:hypothetical protein